MPTQATPSGPREPREHLAQLAMLDTPRDDAFDRLTRLAAAALGTPVALLTFIDGDRQWFKSSFGLAEPWHSRRETPLRFSFCQHVVRDGEPLVVADAHADERTAGSPAIAELGIVAYLGVPLRDASGVAIGSLAVAGPAPREWSRHSLAMLGDFAATVETEIQLRAEIDARERIEAALRASEERLTLALRATGESLWDWKADTGEIWRSDAIVQLIGEAPGDRTDAEWWEERVHPADRRRVRDGLLAALASGAGRWADEYRLRRRDDGYIRVLDRAIILRDAAGAPVRVVGTLHDLEHRARAAEQVRQARQLEAITRVTGGLAHEYNDHLLVIQSALSLVLHDLPDDSPVRADLEHVRQSVQRAADLTSRLFAFVTTPPVAPQPVDAGALLATLHEWRRPLQGRARLDYAPAAGRCMVVADEGQLRHALGDLLDCALHVARADARVQVSAAVESRGEGADGNGAGRSHVVIAVTVSSAALDDLARERLFEPSFGTHGDPHNLADAYAAIRRAGGSLEMAGDHGDGVRFLVRLPREDRATPAAAEGTVAGAARSLGSETVLLVEDQEQVRSIVRRTLERLGYQVLEAADGARGLAVAEAAGWAVDLVVTDVRMPTMNGPELVARLRGERPDVPVLYMSGYTEQVLQPGALDQRTDLVTKPFTPSVLAGRIRRLLDA